VFCSISHIGRYFHAVLNAIVNPAFYNSFVRLPTANTPPSPTITNNPKFSPFFDNAVGCLDGSHIPACLPADDRAACRNRKGFVSQNVLACCSFELLFTYVLSGWEGSAADTALYADARRTDFTIPENKFYLADAGFGLSKECIIPYRGIRYHLQEWGRSDLRYAFHKITKT
jgi:hypothetical protein